VSGKEIHSQAIKFIRCKSGVFPYCIPAHYPNMGDIARLLSGFLFSCQQPSARIAIANTPVDSLINNRGMSWNNHDSTAVRNMFATDALLTDDVVIASGADEISAKMISPYIWSVSNFKASKLQDWSTNERAGCAGIAPCFLADGSDLTGNDSLRPHIRRQALVACL
jgi:hypothetical protein